MAKALLLSLARRDEAFADLRRGLMSQTASALIQKVWNYAHVMRDHGIGFLEYTGQITYLLFLRMAHEREQIGSKSEIPSRYNWASFASKSGDPLEVQCSKALRALGKQPALLSIIFAKAQNKITEPALLERLISMIAEENWSGMDMDVKGEIYEGRRVFKPRALIRRHPSPLAQSRRRFFQFGGWNSQPR